MTPPPPPPPPPPSPPRHPKAILDAQYLDMRHKVLALAADFDRIDRAGPVVDPRLTELRDCLRLCLETGKSDRARRVQELLSDKTPPPGKGGAQ
jgi:hypothetical protein